METEGQADGTASRQPLTLCRWFAPLPSASAASPAVVVEAPVAVEHAQQVTQASALDDGGVC